MEKKFEVYFEDGEGIGTYAVSPVIAMAKAIMIRFETDGSQSFPETIEEVGTYTHEVELNIIRE